MEPNMKMVLEEIQKSREESARRFDEHDAKWERRFADLESTRAATNQRLAFLESTGGAVINPEYERRITELEGFCLDSANVGAVLDPTLERRLQELESLRVERVRDEEDDRMDKLERAVAELGRWRPESEGILDALSLKVSKLTNHYGLRRPLFPGSGVRASYYGLRRGIAHWALRRSDYTGYWARRRHDVDPYPGIWYVAGSVSCSIAVCAGFESS